MRVALLSPLPPEQTGIADYAAHFMRALQSAGVVVSTPLQHAPPLRHAEQARQWAGAHDWSGIDVVHAELGGGHLSEFLALSALTALPHRPALSATVHDPERLVWRPVHPRWQAIDASPRWPRLLKQGLAVLMDRHTLRAERQLAAQLDGLVALTQTGARCLGQRMAIQPDKISTIAHGTLVLPPSPMPPIDRVDLLYFGFIYSGKGIEDLIQALALVRQRNPSWRDRLSLTIAGGTAPDITFGNQHSYLDGLKALVEQLGLSDVVRWVLDVPPRDIPALIQSHHVMVLPYRESAKLALLGQMRGTSGALAWAMAAGRGVITSDARAFAEEVGSGNGESFKQGQIQELAQCLDQLLAQPGKAQAWAQHASQLGQERAWPRTAHAFGAHFKRVMQSRAAGAGP